MSITLDIVGTYRRPRAVVSRHMAGPVREDRAVVYLLLACGLIFVGQWPVLARDAFVDPDIPLSARLGGALLGWIAIAPLVFYVLAGLAHLIAKVFRGRGNWFTARVAVFWGLLAASPLWMLSGLTEGFLGQGAPAQLVGGLALSATLIFWVVGLREAEWPSSSGSLTENTAERGVG